MYKCSVCGNEFVLSHENKYIVRDDYAGGIAAAFQKEERTLYEAFDCPHCGCQNIANTLKRKYGAREKGGVEEVDEGNKDEV